MAESDPNKSYMVLMFVSPIEGTEQIDTIRNDLARRGISPLAVSAGVLRAEQLEIFRMTESGVEFMPEPWVRKDEWLDHYKFRFLPQNPSEPAGAWITAFYHELSEFVPKNKIEKDKDGKVLGVDRAALRELAAREANPRLRRIKGKKRALFLQSYAATLPAPEE